MIESIDPVYIIFGGIGILLSITGVILYLFPPKKINNFYGYRTKKSMESLENWNIANKMAGKIMAIIFALYTVLVILCHLTVRNINEVLIGVLLAVIHLGSIAYLIYIVEDALE